MTPQETEQLAAYQKAYDAAQAAYELEKVHTAEFQDGANRSWATGTWVYPGSGVANDTAWWVSMLDNSKLAQERKRVTANTALATLNDYKAQVNASAEQTFAQNNPGSYADIAKSKIQAGVDAIKVAATQKTTKYLIWGAVALVAVAIVVIILKKKFAA